MSENVLPKEYINRRFHSLAGLWLVIFLLEHLTTNSQAALYIGQNGKGFVNMVNLLHNLPYLHALEILLLGIPFFVHIWWGVKYLLTSKSNNYSRGSHHPNLNKYARNHAYSWQRITSWILLFGVILHVIQMRFLDFPAHVSAGLNQTYYMVKLNMDNGLYPLSQKLQVQYYGSAQIQKEKENLLMHGGQANASNVYNPQMAKQADQEVIINFLIGYIDELAKKPLKNDQVIAVTKNFGVSMLLSVRDTFKSPLMLILYTLFVIAACFHAFNGLWTAMISWGITLTERSQQVMRWIAVSFTIGLALLGLASVWLTYFVNLR